MKRLLLSLLCLTLGVFSIAQELTFEPLYPAPGTKIHFTYNPTDGPFGSEQEFETALYIIGEEHSAHNLSLTWEENVYKGSFETPKDAKAVFLSFFNEAKELVENNGGMGYSIFMYNENQKVVEGGYAAKAEALGNYSRLLKIDFDPEGSLAFIQKEFEQYPQSKRAYLQTYAVAAKYSKDPEIQQDLEATIQQIKDDDKASEEEIQSAIAGASVIEDKKLVEELEKVIIEKFPNGSTAAGKFAEAFYATRDFEEKKAIYQEYIEKYADAEKEMGRGKYMLSQLAQKYGEEEDWESFDKAIENLDDLGQRANILNEVAWAMSGEALDNEAKNLDKALVLSKKSLEFTQEAKKVMTSKPPLYTPQQWGRIKDFNYALFADTYALLLYKKGEYAEAYEYQKISCEGYHYSDADMNHRLGVYIEKSQGQTEALAYLEKMIAEGKANSDMKESFKTLYIANGGSEEAYTEKITSFQASAVKELRKELKEKMINQKAKDFTLLNTEGEEVSLESLKGKVVVLDFWATWCGPCIASFPGMQKAENKYKDNEDVVFLFANTWENGEDKTKKASDFMKKKGYDFQILMDIENRVVGDYGVEGIPTKFIIDPSGRIRFKSVGFQADEDVLINEISVMIELAAENNGVGLE